MIFYYYFWQIFKSIHTFLTRLSSSCCCKKQAPAVCPKANGVFLLGWLVVFFYIFLPRFFFNSRFGREVVRLNSRITIVLFNIEDELYGYWKEKIESDTVTFCRIMLLVLCGEYAK